MFKRKKQTGIELMAAAGKHLAAMQQADTQAEAACEQALRACCDHPDDAKAEQTFMAAESRKKITAARLADAQTKLQVAQAQAEEEEREAKRARREEIRPAIRHHGVMEVVGPLISLEVDLLKQVAQARAQRAEAHETLSGLLREFHSLSGGLGESAVIDHRIEHAVSSQLTCDAIDQAINELADGDPIRPLLASLKPEPEHYETRDLRRRPVAAE